GHHGGLTHAPQPGLGSPGRILTLLHAPADGRKIIPWYALRRADSTLPPPGPAPVRPCMRHLSLALALSCVLPAAGVRADPVSFRTDVRAVLSRAACTQGTCHGSQNGKNGFKLSLRGQDLDLDLLALTRDMLGRRTDTARPADSLILRK